MKFPFRWCYLFPRVPTHGRQPHLSHSRSLLLPTLVLSWWDLDLAPGLVSSGTLLEIHIFGILLGLLNQELWRGVLWYNKLFKAGRSTLNLKATDQNDSAPASIFTSNTKGQKCSRGDHLLLLQQAPWASQAWLKPRTRAHESGALWLLRCEGSLQIVMLVTLD